MQIAEKELIEMISEGEEYAFEYLYENYYVALCIFARKYVSELEVAEEIVQQLFYTIWEKRKELTFKTSLKPYLYSSVKNNSLDYLKHQKVKNNYTKHVLSTSRNESSDYNDKYVSKESLERINRAIEKLPEQRKRVFKMNRFEGLKYREIAVKLQISEKTVENHMGSALKQLRILLKEFIQTK